MTIYEKLQHARAELQQIDIKKSGKNKFAGFSYYELSDFLPHINSIFDKMGLCSIFSLTSDTAQLQIINAQAPEETIVFVSPTAAIDLKGCTAIQALGAAHTYLKRYLYMNALEIVEADALDHATGKEASTEREIDRKFADALTVDDINNLYGTFIADVTLNKNLWKQKMKLKADALSCEFNLKNGKFESIRSS